MIKNTLFILILVIIMIFPLTVKAQGFFDWVGDLFTDLWGDVFGNGDNNDTYQDYNQPQPQQQQFNSAQSLIWSQGECDQLEEYSEKLCDLLWTVQQILYAVGIGLAGIMVILGGITYMSARDSEEQTTKAKKMITNGLIGFAIVIGFALIMGLVRGIVSETLL